MSLFILIPLLLVFQLFTGAFVFSVVNRKLSNSCNMSSHDSCEHWPFSAVYGALWEVAIPITIAAAAGAGVIHLGLQVGRTPSQRRAATQTIIDNRREWKEAQAQAIEDELELQLHGTKECKYCNQKLRKSKGQWVTVVRGENGCPSMRSPGAHAVPDELDTKIEEASKMAEEEGDDVTPLQYLPDPPKGKGNPGNVYGTA